MKSMKKTNYLFLMMLALIFVACEDDEAVLDTVDPIITINAPVSQEEFFADETVTVEATVTDNLGIQTVTVLVTPPGAGEVAREVITPIKVRDLFNDNTTYTLNQAISLGTGTPAPGNYIITVRATDTQGNVTDRTVTIVVMEADNVAPTAVFNTPLADQYIVGEDIIVDASVTDDKMLETVTLVFRSGENEVLRETFDATDFGANMQVFELDKVIAAPNTVGAHTITIEAVDARGNVLDPVLTDQFEVVEAAPQ